MLHRKKRNTIKNCQRKFPLATISDAFDGYVGNFADNADVKGRDAQLVDGLPHIMPSHGADIFQCLFCFRMMTHRI